MSFKIYIYYCALFGGWAALLAWGLTYGLGVRSLNNALLTSTIIGGAIGLFVAMAIGALDALLNSVGFQRVMRVGVCMVVGLLGGFAGGALGQILASFLPSFAGWAIAGLFVGVSIGVYDLFRAMSASESPRNAIRKIINGLIGGVVGGLLGGVPYYVLMESRIIPLDRTPAAVGLTVLGMLIGLLIGLAQVILKEAWLKVESGFRPGRQVILSKAETTIGRGEGCDIGLFGDNGVEKLHARIMQQGNRYLLADANTPGGTYLNEERVGQPAPLRSGDSIRVGRNVIRFGERQKRGDEPRQASAGTKTRSITTTPTVGVDNPFADF